MRIEEKEDGSRQMRAWAQAVLFLTTVGRPKEAEK